MDVKNKTPQEILFAQKLADNERVYRSRSLRKLKEYISIRSDCTENGFTEVELLKLWKGLHYSMWMQDKPLLQEELCANLSSLVHAFSNTEATILFIKAYFLTECREWLGIDKWRMDKFLMLFRCLWKETLTFLQKNNWNEGLVQQILNFLSSHVILDCDSLNAPDGIRFHLAYIYLSELENVTDGKLEPQQTVTFIQPWVDMLKYTKCAALRVHVIQNIFKKIVYRSPIMCRRKKNNILKLDFDYGLLSTLLFEAGACDDTLSNNRNCLYNISQDFKKLAEGKRITHVQKPKPSKEELVLDEAAIESAVTRLRLYKERIKRERQLDEEKYSYKYIDADDEAYGSDEEMNFKTMETETKLEKQPVKFKNKQILSKKLLKVIETEKDYFQENSDDEDRSAVSDEDRSMVSNEDLNQLGDVASVGRSTKPDKTAVDSNQKKRKFQLDETNQEKPNSKKPKLLKANVEKSSDVTEKKPVMNGNEKVSMSKMKNEELATDGVNAEAKANVKNKKKLKVKRKAMKLSNDFEVEEFPELKEQTSDLLTAMNQLANTNEKTKQKIAVENKDQLKSKRAETVKNLQETGNKKVATLASGSKDKNVKKFASFGDGEPCKAKCFKKAASKSATPIKLSSDSSPKTPKNTKRISFGGNSAVTKSSIKLRGSASHDPTKTPEQGILRVNDIQPGTVIQVGKQATRKNTFKNAKYPDRMVALDYF